MDKVLRAEIARRAPPNSNSPDSDWAALYYGVQVAGSLAKTGGEEDRYFLLLSFVTEEVGRKRVDAGGEKEEL